MVKKDQIKLFESQKIRSVWSSDLEEWFFSVVDVIKALTGSDNPRRYWSDLKRKLKAEGSQLYENIVQLKMMSGDGKSYKTDAATPKQLLRLIQSIPSKKAEPFKMWLAEVGNDRLNESQNPELTLERAMKQYVALGYSDEWINMRLRTIEARKDLTDEWKRGGLTSDYEYAVLTNIITKEWSGNTVQEYKQVKNLKKENLRDNMTTLELALNMLAEATTTEISKNENPSGFDEHSTVAKRGGSVAKQARISAEKQLGRSVVSPLNAKELPNRMRKQLK
jgi:hypothetical protein